LATRLSEVEVLDKVSQGYRVRSDVRRKTQLHKIGGSSGIPVLRTLNPEEEKEAASF